MRWSLIFLANFLFLLGCQHSGQQQRDDKNTIFEDINLVDALKYMEENSDYILMDVRTVEEIAEGKISKDALELDFRKDNFRSEVVKLDRERTYLVYCRSGGRSSKAQKIMKEEGFQKVYNIEGGYNAWEDLLSSFKIEKK